MENRTEKKPASVSCGALLKQGREAQNWSTEDIAKKLYLNESIILDLEKDDFQHIPNLTYARGYVRNYAKLVKVSPDEVLAAFSELEWQGKKQADFEAFIPSQDKPMLYGGQTHQPIRSLYVGAKKTNFRWLGSILSVVVVLVVIVLCIVWWWRAHSTASIAQAVATASPATVEPTPEPAAASNAPVVSSAAVPSTPVENTPAPTLPYVPEKHIRHLKRPTAS